MYLPIYKQNIRPERKRWNFPDKEKLHIQHFEKKSSSPKCLNKTKHEDRKLIIGLTDHINC